MQDPPIGPSPRPPLQTRPPDPGPSEQGAAATPGWGPTRPRGAEDRLQRGGLRSTGGPSRRVQCVGEFGPPLRFGHPSRVVGPRGGVILVLGSRDTRSSARAASWPHSSGKTVDKTPAPAGAPSPGSLTPTASEVLDERPESNAGLAAVEMLMVQGRGLNDDSARCSHVFEHHEDAALRQLPAAVATLAQHVVEQGTRLTQFLGPRVEAGQQATIDPRRGVVLQSTNARPSRKRGARTVSGCGDN